MDRSTLPKMIRKSQDLINPMKRKKNKKKKKKGLGDLPSPFMTQKKRKMLKDADDY